MDNLDCNFAWVLFISNYDSSKTLICKDSIGQGLVGLFQLNADVISWRKVANKLELPNTSSGSENEMFLEEVALQEVDEAQFIGTRQENCLFALLC